MDPGAGMAGELREERRFDRKVESIKRIVEASQDILECCEKMIENNNDMIRILKQSRR